MFFKRLFDFIDSLLWLIFSLRSIFFLSLLLLFWCGFYVLVGSVVFQGFLGGSIVSCSSFCDTVCFCNVWYFSAFVGSTFVSCFLSCVKGFPWLFFGVFWDFLVCFVSHLHWDVPSFWCFVFYIVSPRFARFNIIDL